MSSLYSSNPKESRGRLFVEEESTFRSAFQRDRDRIIHSSAFRRLKHKTQVFIEHEGDYFRTRLTHSIEVAQVARTLANVLGLNSALTEAIALAHDLGHPPFGHTGEDALNDLMMHYGGFDHNAQAVRIVTMLEQHYAEFDGLNLTWETLEGIAKHNGPVSGTLPYALAEYNEHHDLELDSHASAEAQVAALADDIAYNSHDLHDGLRAELFSLEELVAMPILKDCFIEVDRKYKDLEDEKRAYEALRRFFGVMVEDVIAVSQHNLHYLAPQSTQDIRWAGRPIIQFSDSIWSDLQVIRKFLFHRVYRAPSVMKKRNEVTTAINTLFPHYMAHPDRLPLQWRGPDAAKESPIALARLVTDYISGMTDRYALQQYDQIVTEQTKSILHTYE